MPGIRIRRATTRDLDILVDQRRKMFEEIRPRTPEEHAIGDRAYRAWARRLMQAREFVGFLAVTPAGRVVAGGCVWLQPGQPHPGSAAPFTPYLLSMYTEPEYRDRGIATRLVREAVRWARERGYRRMTLHASRFARRMYLRFGWERTWEMRVDLRRGRVRPAVRSAPSPRRRRSGRRRTRRASGRSRPRGRSGRG